MTRRDTRRDTRRELAFRRRRELGYKHAAYHLPPQRVTDFAYMLGYKNGAKRTRVKEGSQIDRTG